MSAADNKALVRRFLAALWDHKDATVVDEWLAPHYQRHLSPRTPHSAMMRNDMLLRQH